MGTGESSLADQLYDAVNSQLDDEEKFLTGKITGMLLERDDSMIQQLIEKPSLLNEAIQKAKTSIHSSAIQEDSIVATKGPESDEVFMVKADDNENDHDELGQLLYDKICVVYPMDAAKLTGMLLELDQTRLNRILESESLFKAAVDKAVQVLTDKNEENNCLLDQDDQNIECHDESTEGIGELLFRKVEEIQPDKASKLTGMLLELDLDTLNQLLHNEAMLKEAVRKAIETINRSVADHS